ncbi:hypothetical protein C8Q74DRAFT_1023773 [Fomes fomentarius]|nr:hypothetical protein C8Q74DRAFT_1023773 [Fomes fomentarius]
MRMYTTGEGRFPCVRLQCIKFDARFYKNLVSENDEYFKSRYFPSSDTAEWRNPAKRRKLSHSEHASGSTFQVGSVSTTTSAGPVTPSSSRMSTPISSSRSATPTPSRGSGPPSIKGEDGDHNIDDMYAD